MHLRNLFAGEPGGFQRLQRPICSEANQLGESVLLLTLSRQNFLENMPLSYQQNQNTKSNAMCIIRLLPWVTISISEIEQAVAVGTEGEGL